MNKKLKKQIGLITMGGVLFALFILVVMNYFHPIISHATSTTEQSNGREIKWYYELKQNDVTGKYEATHVYTEDASLEGVLHLPHTLNGYTVTSIGRGIEKNPVIPSDCNVTEISIPDTVSIYEDYSFYQFSHLQKIYRVQTKAQSDLEPTYIPYLNVLDSEQLTTVGYHAFLGCSSLDCMYIPDRPLEIKESAFADCTGLKTVYVGHRALMHDYVFKGCNQLTHLEIDQEQIGNQFQDCVNLESIVFGKNVRQILSDAFRVTRQDPILLNAGTASQQYIYHNNELEYEGTYDAQTVTRRELFFLNPDTTIEHQLSVNFDEQSYQIEHIGMLFPEYAQEFSGKGTGSANVSVFYNYDVMLNTYKTFTSQVSKTNAVTVKEDTTGQNITDFDIKSDSATANEQERVQYTWANNYDDRVQKICYPIYPFTEQEFLHMYVFYRY